MQHITSLIVHSTHKDIDIKIVSIKTFKQYQIMSLVAQSLPFSNTVFVLKDVPNFIIKFKLTLENVYRFHQHSDFESFKDQIIILFKDNYIIPQTNKDQWAQLLARVYIDSIRNECVICLIDYQCGSDEHFTLIQNTPCCFQPMCYTCIQKNIPICMFCRQ